MHSGVVGCFFFVSSVGFHSLSFSNESSHADHRICAILLLICVVCVLSVPINSPPTLRLTIKQTPPILHFCSCSAVQSSSCRVLTAARAARRALARAVLQVVKLGAEQDRSHPHLNSHPLHPHSQHQQQPRRILLCRDPNEDLA